MPTLPTSTKRHSRPGAKSIRAVFGLRFNAKKSATLHSIRRYGKFNSELWTLTEGKFTDLIYSFQLAHIHCINWAGSCAVQSWSTPMSSILESGAHAIIAYKSVTITNWRKANRSVESRRITSDRAILWFSSGCSTVSAVCIVWFWSNFEFTANRSQRCRTIDAIRFGSRSDAQCKMAFTILYACTAFRIASYRSSRPSKCLNMPRKNSIFREYFHVAHEAFWKFDD